LVITVSLGQNYAQIEPSSTSAASRAVGYVNSAVKTIKPLESSNSAFLATAVLIQFPDTDAKLVRQPQPLE